VLYDTQHITTIPKAHHNNKRLSALGSALNHCSTGMADQLHLDYSSLSSEFAFTSCSGTTLAQQMIQSALSPVPSNASTTNPLQATASDSKAKRKPISTTKVKALTLTSPPISLSSDAMKVKHQCRMHLQQHWILLWNSKLI